MKWVKVVNIYFKETHMEVGDHLKDIKVGYASAAWSLVCHLRGLEQSFLLVCLCYDDLGKGISGVPPKDSTNYSEIQSWKSHAWSMALIVQGYKWEWRELITAKIFNPMCSSSSLASSLG